VAGAGLPNCRAHHIDGREGPCLPKFSVRRGNAVNGWSKAGRIEFSYGAITRLTRDEFALLAGHEIAHWYLRHKESSLETELEADQLGAELACAARFDIAKGANLFRYLRAGWSHPKNNVRQQDNAYGSCPQRIEIACNCVNR
jgi:Peptidase family M48